MHPKSFKITSKSNSSLMSISRRGPVNPSILTFPIINLTKPIKSLLLLRKSLKNGYNKLYFLLYTFDMNYKASDVTFSSWPAKSVNPNFQQQQSDRNNAKFNCCLEIQLEIAAIICIFTLNQRRI